jgi:hypothetical protein
MKSFALKVSAMAFALAVAILTVAGTASASHVQVDLLLPDQPAIGQATDISASFQADSGPITGMTVAFHEEVTFGGVTSDVDLGQAVTDASGVAQLMYEPRAAGIHEIHVRYAYEDGEEEDAAASLEVPAPGEQLYRSTSGVNIPGLNVWALMALVAAVWAILLSVAWRVIAIAHADDDPSPLEPMGSAGSR